MLVWWILSLIILIACIVFAYRMIVSTYEFLPADKRYFLGFYKNSAVADERVIKGSTFRTLNSKIQTAEDNHTFYRIQFSKLQERLKTLEDLCTTQSPVKSNKEKPEEEENWKEMYYEENAIKEKLENELDRTRQLLEETENTIKNASGKDTRIAEIQSEYESTLHDLHSLQNHIGLLQRQLEAATEREKELEKLLLSEISLREKYSLLQREFIVLQSEADDLRRRIVELSKKDVNLEARVAHLGELESKLSLCEDEKVKLKMSIEQLLHQNEALLYGRKMS
jgi:chromosome segregation ATPase